MTIGRRILIFAMTLLNDVCAHCYRLDQLHAMALTTRNSSITIEDVTTCRVCSMMEKLGRMQNISR